MNYTAFIIGMCIKRVNLYYNLNQLNYNQAE